jgi:hypothetical protein
MAIVHPGDSDPLLPDSIGVSDQREFWIGWEGELNTGETIASSVWVLPDGFTSVSEQTNQTVTDETTGLPVNNANGILLTVSAVPGSYSILNTMTSAGSVAQVTTKGFVLVVDGTTPL